MTAPAPVPQINLTIDGKAVSVDWGTTIIQAAEKLGIEIPRFCYHKRLSVAGNCRMCLVDVEKSPKPVASCAMPVGEGMVVHTGTPRILEARKGVMEFLLINHPLDCPICDQGGECDLQDIAVSYGSDRSRFHEEKRAVVDKDLGPLIKTIMTRCIHCTRCIRFATEVAGVPEMGATGRGENMEVGTYVEMALSSELSGNMIDLCPVGALTSKPYAFTARPWELQLTESVDVMDALGAHIEIDHREGRVMRVLPRVCDAINEEWISDTSRFSYDGLVNNRLTSPLVRKDGALEPTSWPEAFAAVASALSGVAPARMAGLAGDVHCAEDLFAFKHFMTDVVQTPNLDSRTDGDHTDGSARAAYILNTPIADFDKVDAVLLIGCDPRLEAPLLNARLRKGVLKRGLKVASLGAPLDLTFPVTDLGATPKSLDALLAGSSPFSETLRAAKNGVVLVGAKATLTRADGMGILRKARDIAEMYACVRPEWNGFNVLQQHAGRVAAYDMGVLPQKGGLSAKDLSGKTDVLFVYGEGDMAPSDVTGVKKIIYIGTHDNAWAKVADVVLPAAAYTEKDGLWTNAEGRIQHGRRAVLPPLNAKEDWKIFRALSEHLCRTLPFDTQTQLRALIASAHPAYAKVGEVTRADWKMFGTTAPVTDQAFRRPVTQFYLTNDILRASHVMRVCQTNADSAGAMKKAG